MRQKVFLNEISLDLKQIRDVRSQIGQQDRLKTFSGPRPCTGRDAENLVRFAKSGEKWRKMGCPISKKRKKTDLRSKRNMNMKTDVFECQTP